MSAPKPIDVQKELAKQRAAITAARAAKPVKPSSSVAKPRAKKTFQNVVRPLPKKHWASKGIGFPHNRLAITKGK